MAAWNFSAALDQHVLAGREHVSRFEAAQLDVGHAGADLAPHVVGGGTAGLLDQQRATAGHEAVRVASLASHVEFDAAALGRATAQIAVGAVEFEVGIGGHGRESGSGEQGCGCNSGQLGVTVHRDISSVVGLNAAGTPASREH
jgi:hypothetical protein